MTSSQPTTIDTRPNNTMGPMRTFFIFLLLNNALTRCTLTNKMENKVVNAKLNTQGLARQFEIVFSPVNTNVDKLIKIDDRPKAPKNTGCAAFQMFLSFKMILTYTLILITWLPFRSNDFQITTLMLDSLFQFDFAVNYNNLKIGAFLFFMVLIIDLPAYLLKTHYYLEKLPKELLYFLLFFLILFGTVVNTVINSSPAKPFIYFQF